MKLSPAQIIREKQTMIKRMQIAMDNGEFCKQFSDNVGICSLTKDPLNLLMWAHYAQHHKGFVVEFEIPLKAADAENLPENFLFDWLIPQEVEYQTSKPKVNLVDDNNDVKIWKQFQVKGKDWAYEHEERVIDYVRGHGIHKYDRKTILHSVIAGMKMKDPDYMTLVESINKINKDLNLNIGIYKTEKVKGARQQNL